MSQMSSQKVVSVNQQGARNALGTATLQSAVDAALRHYFSNLGGMSPTTEIYEKVISDVEKPLLENVLRYTRGNQVRASRILGINRNTLRKKVVSLGIELSTLS